jgi:hypothetical protein
MDQSTLDDAIQFLMEGHEAEAARLLRACVLENWEVVDHWRDGSRQLDGILLEVACPRAVYEILMDDKDPRTRSIINAFKATFPSELYLKRFAVRAESARSPLKAKTDIVLTDAEMKDLIAAIETQKASMIAVATGGPRINEVNREYEARRQKINRALDRLSVSDPNPYSDLWSWYGKWSDGSLPTYQSRRRYITELYQPLLDALSLGTRAATVEPSEPTGWARVDRSFEKIVKTLETGKNEEDFQAIALLCREAIISLAQAVYNPEQHEPLDGVKPSPTDAKRMLESFIAGSLKGDSHDYLRKFAKAVFDLAVSLQHRRTAAFRNAALCAEATRSLINVIAVISGQRDPERS